MGCARVEGHAPQGRPAKVKVSRNHREAGVLSLNAADTQQAAGRLTYANIAATLALALVIGGGASYAAGLGKNTVGTKQLKKNAVTSAKVKNGTLKPDDLSAGALFKGMTVVTRTTSFTFPQDNGSTGQILSANVQCDPGEAVVGGGSDLNNNVSTASQPNVIVTHSRPATPAGAAPANGTTPSGWFVQARRNVDTVATTVTVYVLCASESS